MDQGQDLTRVTVENMGAGALMRMQDIWCRYPSKLEMLAYKALGNAGQITDIKVTYSRATGMTIFTYWSTLPKKWIHDALRSERQKLEAVK